MKSRSNLVLDTGISLGGIGIGALRGVVYGFKLVRGGTKEGPNLLTNNGGPPIN